MVTCMETWIMADHAALQTFFKDGFRPNRLLPVNGLETRPRQDVQQALENATKLVVAIECTARVSNHSNCWPNSIRPR